MTDSPKATPTPTPPPLASASAKPRSAGAAGATRWSIVQRAAAGDAGARSVFARTYQPVIRAYLGARWRQTNYLAHLDDAAQDAFVDCFRDGGALQRVDPSRPVKFRTFLYGVVRNVALRYEERTNKGREKQADTLIAAALPAREEALSRVFDRAWAQAVMRRAAERQERAAEGRGPEMQERVELLRLRFAENLPIRDIATRWETDPARLHRQYRKARQEFQVALRVEVGEYYNGTAADVERECAELLGLLGE